MFTSVSWGDYAVYVTVALIIYYIWVFFIFYARNVYRLLNTKKQVSSIQIKDQNQSDEIFSIIYQLQDEIRTAIGEAAGKKYAKPEIIYSLQSVLKKYSLKSTPFQFAVNNFIERQCENNCSIHLNEEDLKQLWG